MPNEFGDQSTLPRHNRWFRINLRRKQLRPAPARAHDRQRSGLAEAANRVGHHLAQLDQRDRVAWRAVSLRQATQDLGLALRADLAGVALAATLMGEEVADARQHRA